MSDHTQTRRNRQDKPTVRIQPYRFADAMQALAHYNATGELPPDAPR